MSYNPPRPSRVSTCLYRRCREQTRPGGGPPILVCPDPIGRQWELRAEEEALRNAERLTQFRARWPFVQEARP